MNQKKQSTGIVISIVALSIVTVAVIAFGIVKLTKKDGDSSGSGNSSSPQYTQGSNSNQGNTSSGTTENNSSSASLDGEYELKECYDNADYYITGEDYFNYYNQKFTISIDGSNGTMYGDGNPESFTISGSGDNLTVTDVDGTYPASYDASTGTFTIYNVDNLTIVFTKIK